MARQWDQVLMWVASCSARYRYVSAPKDLGLMERRLAVRVLV